MIVVLCCSIEQKFAIGASIEDHNAELQQVVSSYKVCQYAYVGSFCAERTVNLPFPKPLIRNSVDDL